MSERRVFRRRKLDSRAARLAGTGVCTGPGCSPVEGAGLWAVHRIRVMSWSFWVFVSLRRHPGKVRALVLAPMALQFKESQQQVPQGGQDISPGAVADPASVLPQADIPAVMGAVFTGPPVVPDGLEQLRGHCIAWGRRWCSRRRILGIARAPCPRAVPGALATRPGTASSRTSRPLRG